MSVLQTLKKLLISLEGRVLYIENIQVFRAVEKRGIVGGTIQHGRYKTKMIQALNNRNFNCIRIINEEFDEFTTRVGVKQGLMVNINYKMLFINSNTSLLNIVSTCDLYTYNSDNLLVVSYLRVQLPTLYQNGRSHHECSIKLLNYNYNYSIT